MFAAYVYIITIAWPLLSVKQPLRTEVYIDMHHFRWGKYRR